jgi:hypothetical protein
MRAASWFLGVALGMIAGGAVPLAGLLALLLIVPVVVWAAREKARPLGLGGVLIGLGAGCAGLIALANARCAASNISTPNYFAECVPPDLSVFFVVAAVLAAIGAGVSLVTIARRSRAPVG